MFHFCCYKLYLNSAYLVDLHPKNNLNNLLHQRIKLHLLFSTHLLGYAPQFSLVPWLRISTLIKLCSELLVLVCCNLSVFFCTHFHSFSVQLCEIHSKMFPAFPQSLALVDFYTRSCLKNVILISPPRGTLVQSCQGCPSCPVHPSHCTGWAYRWVTCTPWTW